MPPYGITKATYKLNQLAVKRQISESLIETMFKDTKCPTELEIHARDMQKENNKLSKELAGAIKETKKIYEDYKARVHALVTILNCETARVKTLISLLKNP
jgi:seryl-tRNA synthetase